MYIRKVFWDEYHALMKYAHNTLNIPIASYMINEYNADFNTNPLENNLATITFMDEDLYVMYLLRWAHDNIS